MALKIVSSNKLFIAINLEYQLKQPYRDVLVFEASEVSWISGCCLDHVLLHTNERDKTNTIYLSYTINTSY